MNIFTHTLSYTRIYNRGQRFRTFLRGRDYIILDTLNSSYYLIVTERFLKWPEISKCKMLTSSIVINLLNGLLVTFGIQTRYYITMERDLCLGIFKEIVKHSR